MLRSTYCCLNEHTDKELTDLGECPYDQVSLVCRLRVFGSTLDIVGCDFVRKHLRGLSNLIAMVL